MDGEIPAPWFVEVNGAKQGPYTSKQIMQLLMDGALKVESKIFDSTSNVWRIAADVIPYLELSATAPHLPKSASRKSWTPPPRPVELKNVHIVDLNSVGTGEVDYFALINDQRRMSARAQALARATAMKRDFQDNRAKQAVAENREAPAAESSRLETTKITRVQSGEATIASAIAANPAAEAGSVANKKDGILMAEVQPGIGFGIDNVIIFARRARKFMRQHKSAFAVAASLTFVFAGTYGTVRVLSERKDRAPANLDETTKTGAATAPALTTSFAGGAPDDTLGRGRNPVHRPHGTSIGQAANTQLHPMLRSAPTPPPSFSPPAQNNNNANEPPRDPPQFYSTVDGDQPQANMAVGNANVITNAQDPNAVNQQNNLQNNNQANPVNGDPNAGVVNPPNLQPQNIDPNDPNRQPGAYQ